MASAAVLQLRDFNIPINRAYGGCSSTSAPRATQDSCRKTISSPNSLRRRRSLLDDEKRRKEMLRKALRDGSEVKELVMEKVRILKRGESLCTNLNTDFVKSSAATDRRVVDSVAVDRRLSVCRKKGVGVEVDSVAVNKQLGVYKKKVNGDRDAVNRRSSVCRKKEVEVAADKQLGVRKMRGSGVAVDSVAVDRRFSVCRKKEVGVPMNKPLGVCRKKGAEFAVAPVATDWQLSVCREKGVGVAGDRFAGPQCDSSSPPPTELPMPKINWLLQGKEKVKFDGINANVAADLLALFRRDML